jgi:hypothetical protein
VRGDRGSSLEEVLIEHFCELEQVPFLHDGRCEALHTALGVIILGKHGVLLFRGLELAMASVEKARELGVRSVHQFCHVGCGTNLNDSSHHRGLGHEWFRFWYWIGHLWSVLGRRCYWTLFRLRNSWLVCFRLRNVLWFSLRCGRFLGVGADKCDDASVFNCFEGICFFDFGFGNGLVVIFLNGFVDLISSGFEALERFFFWRTRLGELLLGTLVTGRIPLR